MAEVLDEAYVNYARWNNKIDLGPDGRIQNAGPLKGRRILYIWWGDAGSLFVPGPSTESRDGWDIIRFKESLRLAGPIPWVEAVAHESAHAFARVSARRNGPTTLKQRVEAAVRDEVNARTVERRVMREIRATDIGRRALANHPISPPVVRCEVERSWFPSAENRTYLEQFVLGMDWENAARKLNSSESDRIKADVAAIDIVKQPVHNRYSMMMATIVDGAHLSNFADRFPVLKSKAGLAAMVLRVVHESWRDTLAMFGDDPHWPRFREGRLQRHADMFFDKSIRYTKCP